MNHTCDEQCECQTRLEAATDVLHLTSARLKTVIFSGREDAIEDADTALRVARVRFLAARAEYREVTE